MYSVVESAYFILPSSFAHFLPSYKMRKQNLKNETHQKDRWYDSSFNTYTVDGCVLLLIHVKSEWEKHNEQPKDGLVLQVKIYRNHANCD